MARAIWSGVISFGLVTIPVRLVSAVRQNEVHFGELHRPD
jgi:DNA end-binding protein Ku